MDIAFNFAVENSVWKVQDNSESLQVNWVHQLLVYVDDGNLT
jgi:hypothetical protein